ncbi:MAG: phage tail protein [Gorillibacterium sp.]|nr:phage tail protein [Gorillibacterium sp.]
MVDVYHYTTLAGDTWDSIALDFYNEERTASVLVQANLKYRSVITFQGGELLQIPIIEAPVSGVLPPWKRV